LLGKSAVHSLTHSWHTKKGRVCWKSEMLGVLPPEQVQLKTKVFY